MSRWNEIYQRQAEKYDYYNLRRPHEDMVKVESFFQERGAKMVADLGCGLGRNLIFLAKRGFIMSGIDLSEIGIINLKDILHQEGVEANLSVGNIYTGLPYRDRYFDAAICVQTLQHGNEAEIKRGIGEIERVLKPNGVIFVTLPGRYCAGKLRPNLVRTAKVVADRTYVPTQGNEAGLPHFIYNKRLIRQHFRNFDLPDMWKDNRDYYCFLGEKV